MARMNPQPPLAARLAERPVDPDLVDRIFEMLAQECPDLVAEKQSLAEVKARIRSEFAGEKAYIKTQHQKRIAERAEQVLRLFNGRNATEVARRLGIGRGTVYRILKRAGSTA